ncbi:hypothetical protein [Singulisphaera sp. GP187]|uniref:glycosyltransferase family 39 protein n=1 Tax=Singulisphaera sp. GP187 TaxID=1882752 RepID=UPI000940D50C|nr:hypothetical protein [Singulisphaera sp. GP187]
MSRRVKRRVHLAILAALTVVLRLPYLTERSLWFDEASSWQTASFTFTDMMNSLRLNVHMPLYYVLLRAWMEGFGDSVASLRGLSVLFGTLSVVLMYEFGRELYLCSGATRKGHASSPHFRGHEFALMIAGLVAVSPFQVHAAIEARMYSLGTALTALSSWILLRALRRVNSTATWMAYSLASLALLYTHHYGILTVTVQYGFILAYAIYRYATNARDYARRLFFHAAGFGIATLVAYVPGLFILLGQVKRVREDYWIRPMSWWTVPNTFSEFTVPFAHESGLGQAGPYILLLFAICCLVVANRGAKRGDAFVLISAIGPMCLAATISLATPIWYYRYFRFAHLFILAAVVLATWRVTRTSPRARAILFADLVVGMVLAYILFWKTLDIPNGPGPRGAVERILAMSRGGEIIVTTDYMQYFPAKYYVGGRGKVQLLWTGPDHAWGPHLVRPSDLISPGELSNCLGSGVWVLSSTPRSAVLPSIDRLEPESSFTVPFYQPLHRTLYANRYRVRSRPRGGPEHEYSH